MATSPNVASLITRLARMRGIDPEAVLAVAKGEGGLQNREGDIGDLAGGGSYGPFQLYAQGALPAHLRGKPQAADQWAWSPAGIAYALDQMKSYGASGLRGADAVRNIITRFERPANPQKSISLALSRLGMQSQASPSRSRPGLPISATGSSGNPRQALLSGLAAGKDVFDIIPDIVAARSMPAMPSLGSSKSLAGSLGGRTLPRDSTPPQGVGAWMNWVGRPEKRSGPSKPHNAAILQFVGRVGQIAGKKLTPWGNESHSLTTVNGRPSDHGSGNAADIPATGEELIRIGQAALIAAGADPAWARKQRGGLYNIGGRQIIFATNQGGNHHNHLHVSN